MQFFAPTKRQGVPNFYDEPALQTLEIVYSKASFPNPATQEL
jgi:hypothetical protein